MQASRNTVGERRRRVAVVGGGQAGLQLALGLTGAGYAVTLATDRDADALERGTVRSTQCMFDAAMHTERRLGLDAWQSSAPQIHALEATIAGVDGAKALEFTAPLRSPAQSVDQRLKLPRWLRELEALHGAVRVGDASLERLEELADDHELVVIASGQGPSPRSSSATALARRTTGRSARWRSPTSTACHAVTRYGSRSSPRSASCSRCRVSP